MALIANEKKIPEFADYNVEVRTDAVTINRSWEFRCICLSKEFNFRTQQVTTIADSGHGLGLHVDRFDNVQCQYEIDLAKKQYEAVTGRKPYAPAPFVGV